jgi:cobalt-zinc-cadmium efflux system outer membrane protein
MHSWSRAGATALLGFLLGVPVRAAEPIDFAEAARRTLAAHPETRRVAAELEAARARADTAAQRPALELGAEVENVAGTGRARRVDSAELTLSVGSVLERATKRDARVAAAERTVDLLGVEQRIVALDRLAETARRFVRLAVAQERVAIARAALTQADTTLVLIRPRVEAARSARTELLNAEIERSRAEVELEAAQRDLVGAQAALAAQWSEPHERPTVAVALFDVPEPAAPAVLAAALASTPDLERYATEARVASARLELARAQATPDWRWQVGVRRRQDSRDQALVAGVSVPFGQARRAEPEIRERRAELAQIEASATARRVDLERLLTAESERLHALRQQVRAITHVQIPRAHEASELTERGYRIGRFPYRELAAANEQVISLELARLDAASQYHLTRVEIERLTGAQLDLLEE